MDWLELWSELAQVHAWTHQANQPAESQDRWRNRAHDFDAQVRRRWTKNDSSRAFIVATLDRFPNATVLDIGAGTGKWAVLLAPHARRITALEPSPGMIERMRQNLADANITNVDMAQDAWPHAQVATHDFTLCAHAMYGAPDFRLFIERMQAVTRQMCFLLLRAPTIDGVMAEAAQHIWGHPHDSPNFQVAFNALLQMGIFPNVLMEDSGLWEPWSNDSLADAVQQIKHRMGLDQIDQHDAFLLDLAQRRLTVVEGKYVWPPAVRTALLYWSVADSNRDD
ncbi:MAG: class I SAM-dependent methyltransferase [Chloroflexi bacterium]|nr:class I SAM-dependent methyltransferase [Chloroflexota bacterium]